jgi:hypothetical protein
VERVLEVLKVLEWLERNNFDPLLAYLIAHFLTQLDLLPLILEDFY